MVAIVTAKLMRRYLYPVDETPFVMELPPYRVPTLQATLRHMWEKGVQYLRKMGGVILVGSLIIWFLSYYPRPEYSDTTATTTEQSAPDYSNSYLGRIGRVCEPVMEPIGLNWKGSVAILSGAAAKEIVVSTLGVLYAEEPLPETTTELSENASLGAKLVASGDFDTRTAIAFMVFILLYFPCVATLIAIAKETGRWYWAAVTVLYNTAVAWIVAYIVYLIGGLF
jgi:ferrous iron transport protein B